MRYARKVVTRVERKTAVRVAIPKSHQNAGQLTDVADTRRRHTASTHRAFPPKKRFAVASAVACQHVPQRYPLHGAYPSLEDDESLLSLLAYGWWQPVLATYPRVMD